MWEGSCFLVPENLAGSLECGVLVCVVNFIWRMRLGRPASRAMHPQSQGHVRCRSIPSGKRAGQDPSTQQGAQGSEMLSENTLLSRVS